jgi:hypothetical protein
MTDLYVRERAAERKYWRKLWREVRGFRINLPDKQWCNYYHQHFDWDSRGAKSRLEHRKHIRLMMHAFARARVELASQETPYQLWAQIHPSDPGSDAIYVHTPNPHTEFPMGDSDERSVSLVPPLMMGLVCLKSYRLVVCESESSKWYVVSPRD